MAQFGSENLIKISFPGPLVQCWVWREIPCPRLVRYSLPTLNKGVWGQQVQNLGFVPTLNARIVWDFQGLRIFFEYFYKMLIFFASNIDNFLHLPLKLVVSSMVLVLEKEFLGLGVKICVFYKKNRGQAYRKWLINKDFLQYVVLM